MAKNDSSRTSDEIITQLLDYVPLNNLALAGLPEEFRAYAAGTSNTPPSTEAIAAARSAGRLTEAQVAVATGVALPGMTARETTYQAALDGLTSGERTKVLRILTPIQVAVAQVRRSDALARASAQADLMTPGQRDIQTTHAGYTGNPSQAAGEEYAHGTHVFSEEGATPDKPRLRSKPSDGSPGRA